MNMQDTLTDHTSKEVCLFKYVTNIPCPSCGATRAVVALLAGNFLTALTINPMGIIIALIMLLAPVWVITDLLRGKSSLFKFYRRLELFLQKPQYSIPMVTLVVLNWMWSINKGL
jgi:Fe2+ transport system protein B